MPYTPLQIRSSDPWSENRYSNNLNLKAQILTQGKNRILSNNSFVLSIKDSTTISVTNGMCIIDNVLIHVTNSFDLKINDPTSYFSDSTQINNGVLHIYFQYRYSRSLPAPSLSCGFKNVKIESNSDVLWGGYAVIKDGAVIKVGRDDSTILNNCISLNINGGVVCRDINNPNTFVWVESWLE